MTLSAINHYKTLLYTCLFLRTPYFTSVFNLLLSNLWPISLELMPEGSLSATYFPCNAHHSFLHLGTLERIAILGRCSKIPKNKSCKADTCLQNEA